MKYITFTGDECQFFRRDYNTDKYTEAELLEICNEWSYGDEWAQEEFDGTEYWLEEAE